jgi:frataxin
LRFDVKFTNINFLGIIMDESAFVRFVTNYLDQLLERVEASYWSVVESELNEGVLKIQTETNQVFIINRNIPRQELWLSSPFSGGAHFSYSNEEWLNTRTQEPFEPLLFKELDQLSL